VKGAGRAALLVWANLDIEGKINPAGFVDNLGRHGFKIAGHAPSQGIGDEIDAAATLGAAALDRVNNAAQAKKPVLIGQSLDLGADRGIGLAFQKARRVPENVGQDGAHGQGKDQQVDGRKTKGGGLQYLRIKLHVSCIRLRARFAEGVRQSPCRSSTGALIRVRLSHWSADRNDSPRHSPAAWCG